jgi:hypothetical protein
MSPLFRLVYVSTIAPSMTEVDLQVLLGAAQMRNRRLDVTGVLVRGRRHFAQHLEGRADALEQVMARVRADARHSGLVVLARTPITKRQFGRWDMRLVPRASLDDELDRLREADGLAGLDLPELVAQWDFEESFAQASRALVPVPRGEPQRRSHFA